MSGFTSSSFAEWLQQTLSVYAKLEDGNKNTTLNALIAASGPSQLYDLSARLPEFLFRDFISHLPLELVTSILQYVDGQQLLVCCQVCKSWNYSINQLTVLWRQLAVEAGADVTTSNCLETSNFPETEESFKEHEVRSQRGQIYKKLYLQTLSTLRGFTTGTSITILEEFIDKGTWRITFVGYFNGHIVTGCDDHTVQVWDIPSGRLLTTIATHSVSCLTMTNNYLYTASFNANAESWNLATCCHNQTFCGHTSAVLAIDVTPDEAFLLTGSVDKTAKLWDLRQSPSQLVKTFSDVHEDWVFAVKFLPDKEDQLQLLTCDSGSIILWHVKKTGDVIVSFTFLSDKPSKFTSFYHVPKNSFQMFSCQWEEDTKSSWFTEFTIFDKICSIERRQHFQISLDSVKAYLLGAGNKFAVIMCSISRKDFHIIDIPKELVVATIATPDFCMLTRNGSTATLCDTRWLNGFDFTTLNINIPVFAASVGRNVVILGTWAETSKRSKTDMDIEIL